MDELRIEIWDLLYRAQEPRSIPEIAVLVDRETADVRAAVDHEWFTIVNDVVSISRPAETR